MASGLAQGRTGGVFDNKIGVLDMGDPMRWSDPGLEMRAEDNMPQAREHSAICYDPEVFPGTACVDFFLGGGWVVVSVLNSRVFSWRKRETRNAGACETLVQYIVYSLRAPQSTWPSRQLHANRNWYPHLWPSVFAAKFTKQKRAAPGVAFGDLWWLGQQMVGWRMANQRLLHCWTTLCHYEGRTALRPCHRTNEGHYLWRGFSVHQWYGHLVKDG